MDLFRCMQAFVATVQAGSMSAAAGEVRLSPAMVGQHVASLEERLGTRLLNRTTRRQSLTDFGACYFEQCRDILDRVAVADAEAEALQTRARGVLRVTAPISFGSEILAPALGRYRALSPEVKLDITLTDRNVDLVDEGFDIAFRVGALADNRIIARPLAPYRMMICAAPKYLYRMGTPVHPSELSSHECVVFTPASQAPWRLTKDAETVEVEPGRKITINNGQAVREAARAGLGVIMQPAILVERDVSDGFLIRLFSEWQLGERPMWLLYYRDRRMSPRLRSFISFALTAFGVG
jgi:DNA-binding transcriptional LysR family regulator